MAEAKVTKKAKYSVILKNSRADFYSVVVLVGSNAIAWRSMLTSDPGEAKKTANEMAKFLGTKTIDQT